MANQLSFERLAQLLADRFPKLWIKPGEQFDARQKDSLWTGEGSYITVVEDGEAFELDAFDMYGDHGLYECGVVNQLAEFLSERGFYTEAYDGGTFFIYRA